MNRLFDQEQALQATTASTVSPIQQVAQQINVPPTQVTSALPAQRATGGQFSFDHPKLKAFYNMISLIKGNPAMADFAFKSSPWYVG